MTDARSTRVDAYARGGYRRVGGWLGPDTIDQVLRIAEIQLAHGVRGHVGEIGVHHGKLLILLALLARDDERAVAVDLFEQQELNVDRSGQGDRAIFEANVLRHAGSLERVAILSGDSTQLSGDDLRQAAGGPLRLLSIDGGHLAHIVRHDLQTAHDALCEGGVVILDDYFNPEFPGVSEGTAAFFLSGEAGDLVPFLIGANKIYLTTRSHAASFMERFVRADLGLPLAEMAPFRFHEGATSPVILTELFGARALAYSPDRYGSAHRVRRSMSRSRRALRERLSRSGYWERYRESAVGRALKRVADRLLPY